MDRLIVERKLDSLQRCLARITSRRPRDVAALEADLDLQDVLVLNLSRAVQICVDLAAHLLSGLSLPPPDTKTGVRVHFPPIGSPPPGIGRKVHSDPGFPPRSREIAVAGAGAATMPPKARHVLTM